MRNSRFTQAVLVLLIAFIPALGYGQQRRAEPAPKAPETGNRSPKNFDARSAPGATVRTAGSRATAIVERRRSAAAAVLAAERVARPGTRITLNRHGIPKVFTRDGAPLSEASASEPEEIAKGFLRAHSAAFQLSADEITGLRTLLKDAVNGAVHLTMQQTAGGVDVFEGQLKFTLDAAGQLVQAAGGESAPGIAVSGTRGLSADEAGRKAIAFAKASAGSIMATPDLNVFPIDSATGRLAYRCYVLADPATIYEVVVDAENGALLYLHNLRSHQVPAAAHGTVWKKSPMEGTRQQVSFPSSWIASGATVTTGNNVDVFLDADANQSPDNITTSEITAGRAASATQAFDFAFGDGTVGLNPRKYQSASMTNLFYFVNMAHDYYYDLGFTESAGNFQTDNLGKGGLAGDAVKALAQYGGFTNNAVFSTPRDGIAPVMAMGLFTRGTSSTTDDLDTAYSGQVIVHEYGHGVSNRLVGSGASTSCLDGLQSGALGEGWSDYFALSFTNDPVMGAYETQNLTRGIRRQSYDGYTFKYEDVGNAGFEVHRDGEIWAATLWDMRKTLGQSISDRLVVGGLKATPCNPSMTDARDAIFATDQASNSGANRAQLWNVFARHGLGFSAHGTDGITGEVFDAAYDLPTDLQSGGNPAITSKPLLTVAGAGAPYAYSVVATNPNSGTLNYSLTSGPAGMSVDPNTGLVQWTGTFTPQRAQITVTDGKGGKAIHGYMVPALTGLAVSTPVTIAGEKNSEGFAYVDVPEGVQLLQITLHGGSGDPDLYVTDPDGNLELSGRDGPNETLSFAYPRAGRWNIEVDGYTEYSEVALSADFVVPKLIPATGTQTGLSAEIGSETFYRISVPANATRLTISTTGGSGNVDLFLQRSDPPLCQASPNVSTPCSSTPYFSDNTGNTEAISVTSPTPGDWYLNLSAYGTETAPYVGYTGLTLTTSVATSGLNLNPTVLSFSAQAGSTTPLSQSLALTNSQASSYNWTAQSSASWLKVDKASGSGDATLSISVNPSSLTAGSYTGAITITATGVPGSPQTIVVNLTVSSRSSSGLPRTGTIAHIAAGDVWQTGITLVNSGSSAVTARLVFHTESGAPWAMPLTVSQQGASAAVTADFVERTIEAHSTLVVSAGSGMPQLQVGSAEVLSSGAVSGYAIFRSTGSDGKISEGTVPLQTAFPAVMIIPFDHTDSNQMGIALANFGDVAGQITVTAWDESGASLGSPATLQVAAGGHTSFALPSVLDATRGKRGMVQFQNSAGGLGGIGLRFIPYGTFTSVPSI